MKTCPPVPFHGCSVGEQHLSSKCQDIRSKAVRSAGLCHAGGVSEVRTAVSITVQVLGRETLRLGRWSWLIVEHSSAQRVLRAPSSPNLVSLPRQEVDGPSWGAQMRRIRRLSGVCLTGPRSTRPCMSSSPWTHAGHAKIRS